MSLNPATTEHHSMTFAPVSEGGELLSDAERERLHAQIAYACEAIAPNWPIRTFTSRNPLSGFEHMPFDMAVRRAQELFGGKGYLSNDEFRELYNSGRITPEGLRRALEQAWPSSEKEPAIVFGRRTVKPADVLAVHLLYGIENLPTQLFQWKVVRECATRRFRSDVPEETKRRVASRVVERLRKSLDQVGRQHTLLDWVGSLTGIDFSSRIFERLNKEQYSAKKKTDPSGGKGSPFADHASMAPEHMTVFSDNLLHRMGVPSEQFAAYRDCVTAKFQAFKEHYPSSELNAQSFSGFWLWQESNILKELAQYLWELPGRLDVLKSRVDDDPELFYVTGLWLSLHSVLDVADALMPDRLVDIYVKNNSMVPSLRIEKPTPISLGLVRPLSFWLSRLSEEDVTDQIDAQMVSWCSAFLDEGLASWGMPERRKGFYQAWRELAVKDLSGAFLGIERMSDKIANLPIHPEDAIALQLNKMGIPKDQWEEYLTRHLAQLPGWVGYIRWRGDNPDYPSQRHYKISPVKYLAVRLFYEAELVQVVCQREWNIKGSLPQLEAYFRNRPLAFQTAMGHATHENNAHLGYVCKDVWRLFELSQFLEILPEEVQQCSPKDLFTILEWLDRFPAERHGRVWQEAYEEKYRRELLAKLAGSRESSKELDKGQSRPRAQVAFCIDVRSEPLRRHLEAQGQYETIGFAGFFGVPICYQAFGSTEEKLLCPVLLKPKHNVKEVPRIGTSDVARKFDLGLKWKHLSYHLFHDLKSHPITSLMLIDILGGIFGLALLGKTLVPSIFHRVRRGIDRWLMPRVPTRIPVEKFSEEECMTLLALWERSIVAGILRQLTGWRRAEKVVSPDVVERLWRAAISSDGRAKGKSTDSLARLPDEHPSGLTEDQFHHLVKQLQEEYGINEHRRMAELDRLSRFGFTRKEQVFMVETPLRVMSLTRNFARLVLLCGHGSSTDNNPYASAYDCGACGGSPGGPNARVLASLANKLEVRDALRERGVHIPSDTWFLAGIHNTTTDQVSIFDLEELPETHRPDVVQLTWDLEKAGLQVAMERCTRLPGATPTPHAKIARRQVQQRSMDWSQIRPEWGLSKNAAFIIGKRSITQGLNLEGRTFLHNYIQEQDENGKVLETIMTAPLVVAEWINLQYYFSAVDPWTYGCGSKVLHNVASGIGVMLGSRSDFQTGLPLQTVRNQGLLYHEPMRLLIVIQASIERISTIVQRHTILQYFFNHQWVQLVAVDPQSGEFRRYKPGGAWEIVTPEGVALA